MCASGGCQLSIQLFFFFFFVKKKNIYSCQSYFQYWNYSSSPEGNPAATVVFLFCRLKNEKKEGAYLCVCTVGKARGL